MVLESYRKVLKSMNLNLSFHECQQFRHGSLTGTFLRILNVSERGAKTSSGQAPTADRLPLLFRGIRRASTSISSSHPPSSPTVLPHLYLAGYCRPLPRRFVRPASAPPTAPRGPAVLDSPNGPPVSPRPGRTSTIGLHRGVEQAWAPMTTP